MILSIEYKGADGEYTLHSSVLCNNLDNVSIKLFEALTESIDERASNPFSSQGYILLNFFDEDGNQIDLKPDTKIVHKAVHTALNTIISVRGNQ